MMKFKFIQSKVGEVFLGVVTDVMPFGLFLVLESGVSGLAHISALGPDRFEFNESKKLIRGTHTGKVFKVGQKVSVQVLKVDPESRHVELGVVQET